MTMHSDNEDWIIEVGGGVAEKKANSGLSGLTSRERLIYCLWVADYGMRNAGDLVAARDLYPDFQLEGASLATDLDLSFTRQSFSLVPHDFEREYLERFERICNEIKAA
jgi:hypothetical protein